MVYNISETAIVRLRVGGRQSDVARKLGMPQMLSADLHKDRTTHAVFDRHKVRISQLTDHNDDHYFKTYALRHCYKTAKQLQAYCEMLGVLGFLDKPFSTDYNALA